MIILFLFGVVRYKFGFKWKYFLLLYVISDFLLSCVESEKLGGKLLKRYFVIKFLNIDFIGNSNENVLLFFDIVCGFSFCVFW